MNDQELARIAALTSSAAAPDAALLTPEVRSGSSFVYAPNRGGAPAAIPFFMLVWSYRVPQMERTPFAQKISTFESNLPQGLVLPNTTKVTYRGTYSVTISAVLPEYEYRTYWGLEGLAALEELNNAIQQSIAAGGALKDWIQLVDATTVMRSELMGLTAASGPMFGPP